MSDSKKILLVEDDVSLSDMYRLKFEKEWFEVKVSENWFDALVKIQEFRPDVILLDIMMPDIDWFETLEVIRKQTTLDTKIIMFSNLNRKDDIDKALELGADDYLIKANVTPREAVKKVLDMLNISTSWEKDWVKQDQNKSNSSTVTCPNCWHQFDNTQK